MSERKLLGQGLNHDERISLAQLTTQPGWKVLVRMMAEACRAATEDVIKLKPTTERYPEQLVGLQTLAHAMNKFSAELLDSVKLHQTKALIDGHKIEGTAPEEKRVTRFTGFKAPAAVATVQEVQSSKEAEVESN